MQLGQTQLFVTKFRECVEFYRDALGFEVVRGDPGGPLVAFRSGGQVLGIFDRLKLPADLAALVGTAPSGGVVLVVSTEDIDAAYARLSALGITYVIAPQDFPEWGTRSSVCRDPEGNLIEIVPLAGRDSSVT